MRCEHDLAERETACVDGYCPLCLRIRITKLTEAIRGLCTYGDIPKYIEEALYRILEDE